MTNKPETDIRCVSLWQPYAEAVAAGIKPVETRTPGCPFKHYTGRWLIHAGKRKSKELAALYKQIKYMIPSTEFTPFEQLPRGHHVAICDVGQSVVMDEKFIEGQNKLLGYFTVGNIAFPLSNIVRLQTPIKDTGSQGLWIPSESVLLQLERQGISRNLN